MPVGFEIKERKTNFLQRMLEIRKEKTKEIKKGFALKMLIKLVLFDVTMCNSIIKRKILTV